MVQRLGAVGRPPGRRHRHGGPTLLATIGDVAHPTWRASAVGVYRLWRASGFAVGALLAAILADAFGLTTSLTAIVILTAASGVVVAKRICETHPPAHRI